MDNNFHRDYITNPKPNGYRSLHDLLSDATGTAIELQTRTRQMDTEAEIGAASHAQYKTGEQSCLASNAAERFAAKQRGMESNGVVIVYDEQGILHKLVPETCTDSPTVLDLAFAIDIQTGLKATAATIDGARARLQDPIRPGQQIMVEAGKKAEFYGRAGMAKTSLARAVLKAANRGNKALAREMKNPAQLIAAGKGHLSRLQAEVEKLGDFSDGQQLLGCFSSRRAQVLYPLERVITRKGFASIDEFCLVLALLEESDRTAMLARLRARILDNLVLVNVHQSGQTATLELVVVDKPGVAFTLFQLLKTLGLTIAQANQRPVTALDSHLYPSKLAGITVQVPNWKTESQERLSAGLVKLYNDVPEADPSFGRKVTLSCAIVDTRPDDLLAALSSKLSKDSQAFSIINRHQANNKPDNFTFASQAFLSVLEEVSRTGVNIAALAFHADPHRAGEHHCKITCHLPLPARLKRFIPPAERTSMREIPQAFLIKLAQRLSDLAGTRSVVIV